MDARQALEPIRCFLLDLDGTFYLGDRLIDGALDFLAKLRETGRQCLFLTNNSSRSAAFYVEKLHRLGAPDAFCRVLTSGQAAAAFVKREYPQQKAFLLANEIERAEMEALGVAIDENHPDYVLITYDTELNYRKLTRLCDFVRAGLPYVATHPDLNCPTESGFAPDIGATIAYVKASTGREPDRIIGKPHPDMVQIAMEQTGLRQHQLAMAGDRLYTDVAAGLNAGILSVLVLSGETTRDMAASSPIQADLTVERLSSLIPYL